MSEERESEVVESVLMRKVRLWDFLEEDKSYLLWSLICEDGMNRKRERENLRKVGKPGKKEKVICCSLQEEREMEMVEGRI